ncbi:MAG: hypothetical protein Q9170_000097 [Blastenia crenularia]
MPGSVPLRIGEHQKKSRLQPFTHDPTIRYKSIPSMGKRKRVVEEEDPDSKTASKHLRNGTNTSLKTNSGECPKHFSIQVIAGSYERILHGITASVKFDEDGTDSKNKVAIQFADTFLFNAHGSAIRCLALSPPSKQDKITLVSGSSDQTVKLYQLSTKSPPIKPQQPPFVPSLVDRTIIQHPRNKELGSLQHHAASVNTLKFPTRSKLLSAADDNTIAIVRTRDWTILSTIKIPIPKAHGRPSGDTAPLGGTPAGVSDFAIHPSMKLMVSVSKGERCIRLWNLVTGKKAGVLNFDKALLHAVGEGRWGRGEGYKVQWNNDGEEFVIGFEKGAVVFGLVGASSDLDIERIKLTGQDAKPKGIIRTSPCSKIHQLHYMDPDINDQTHANILAVSTEDGRVVLFSTSLTHGGNAVTSNETNQIPRCRAIGEIGGKLGTLKSRVKDFEFLRVPESEPNRHASWMVTGSSEGTVRVWKLDLSVSMEDLHTSTDDTANRSEDANGDHGGSNTAKPVPQVGLLLGEYETGNRIICLKAFIMANRPDREDVSRSLPDSMADRNGGTAIMGDDNSD